MATRPEPVAGGRQPIPVPLRWSPWRRVARARDLVALWISWRGLDLADAGRRGAPGGRALVGGADGGLLRLRFDFQHMAEQSLFAFPPPLSDPVPPGIEVPVPVRAAGQSRLVLVVPAGEAIPWSVAGLLDAMGRLQMAVAPSAQRAGLPSLLIPGIVTAGASLAGALEQIDTGFARHLPKRALNLVEGQRAMVAANRLVRGGVLAARDTVVVAEQAAGRLGELLKDGGRVGPQDRLPDHLELDDALPDRLPGMDRPGRRWTLPDLRAPTSAETAIEAPFRLLLSPSAEGAWAHASDPVEDGERTGRVELWHSRLAVRGRHGTVDEASTGERIVRAVWTRDRDGHSELPFPSLPTASQREAIVLQTAGCKEAPSIRPRPAQVRRMALSSVGAWIDLTARWNPIPYLDAFAKQQPPVQALAAWEHVAPMGRDQYVRIDTPGYLFPLGHAATLVTISYRQIVGANRPQAALFRKQFITLNETERGFTRRDLPFVHARLSPDRTPDLAEVKIGLQEAKENLAQAKLAALWPIVQDTGERFEWKIEAQDHDGQPVHLQAPLVFVPLNAAIDNDQNMRNAIINRYAEAHPDIARGIPANGQQIAFAPALADGEGRAEARASAEVARVLLGGEPRSAGCTPFMRGADIAIPAIQRLTPGGGNKQVAYPKIYTDSGFAAANAGNVYLELVRTVGTGLAPDTTQLAFGSSERSGGFIKPDVIVAGLSRANGLVSNVQKAAEGTFDPAQLFGALPKLFGTFNLFELVAQTALENAPRFVTQALDQVSGVLEDLASLKQQAESWGINVPPTGDNPRDLLQTVEEVSDAIQEITAGDITDAAKQRVEAALGHLAGTLPLVIQAEAEQAFEPVRRATIGRLVAAVQAALENKIVQAVLAFADGIVSGGEFRARMEWRPKLVEKVPSEDQPLLVFTHPDNALSVVVEARASGARPAGLEVTAQLSDFHFNLVPDFPLMEVWFKRIAFVASAARRPEIDIVFGELKFVGVLSFVQVLKDLIPLDGFSDPPFLDVSTEGISAGFTLALPNLAIGVFSLTNLSLGADARVPFLGNTPVSVGFNFCTRERPFTLAVAFLGGGGFLGIRLDPQGLVMLEGAFEFGAVVALDFGVASGSVSVMAGIYFKIEGDEGQLTGYVRIRGEVDVLGLISASLELYLALTYYTAPQDKLVGEARMTIKVEVLFFSTSVSVTARRVFAGSNGDPTVRDMLQYEERGTVVWDEYLAAFAGEGER